MPILAYSRHSLHGGWGMVQDHKVKGANFGQEGARIWDAKGRFYNHYRGGMLGFDLAWVST
jgi:hypothetical protein